MALSGLHTAAKIEGVAKLPDLRVVQLETNWKGSIRMQSIDALGFEAKAAEGGLVVVDVRSGAEVRGEWLDGCIHLPIHELSAESLSDHLASKDCDDCQPVYLLCASGNRAKKAAHQLNDGLENPLYVIDGGIEALKSTSLPIRKGEKLTMSLERQVRIAAGVLVLLGVVVGITIAPWGFAISAFVGAGLTFAGVTDTCAMGMMLARMPWNRA